MSNGPHTRYEYDFRIVTPMDRNAKVLVCTRYTFQDRLFKCQHLLTETGWHEYQDFEALPVDLCMAMSGREMHDHYLVELMLNSFEAHIRAAIAHDINQTPRATAQLVKE
jgi:hypothetical protein